jgi:hypothetical protein
MEIEDRVSEQRTRDLRCGFKRWLELAYCIRNGEKAIPHPGAGHRQGTRPAERREPGERKPFLRTVFVFDRAQLEALPLEPAALDRPTEPVTGGSHTLLMAPLPALRSRAVSGSR